jgi:hypothetical protein
MFSSRHLERWARGPAVALLASCSAGSNGGARSPEAPDSSVVRYRLQLRANPVSPSAALHCYASCQPETTPEGYLACLEQCPGFERTPGVACLPDEVPPVAACFTARALPTGVQPGTRLIVIGVVANVALVVGLASVCASQDSPCTYAEAGVLP